MHLVVFVEELVRSRGAVLNMPSWFNAYTRVCEPHHSTFVSIASCLQGLSLKKQELVSELVAAKHDTEARLRDTKQYGMYELLLAWLPHQVGRAAYKVTRSHRLLWFRQWFGCQAWLNSIHKEPDFFWVEREARFGSCPSAIGATAQTQPQQ